MPPELWVTLLTMFAAIAWLVVGRLFDAKPSVPGPTTCQCPHCDTLIESPLSHIRHCHQCGTVLDVHKPLRRGLGLPEKPVRLSPGPRMPKRQAA